MESVESQLNIDMLQQPRFTMFAPSRNMMPFRYDQNGKMNEPKIFDSVPTMAPIKTPLPYDNIQTFNKPNLNPRSLMNYAQPSYGNARDQLSLITNLELNYPGKLLPVNNKVDFTNMKFNRTTHKMPAVPAL
jgi:hypothetical protein